MIRRAFSAGALSMLLAAPRVGAAPNGVGFAPSGVDLSDRRGGVVPLDAKLRDSNQAHVRLGALLGRGRPALLVLAYSRCAMLCNLVLRGLSDNLRNLELQPGRDFDLVTISIDPRDSAAQLTRVRHAALARAGYENQLERWQFLGGDEREIGRVAESVGFRYRWDERTEQFAHPAAVMVLSGSGEVRHYLQGVSWPRAELLRALRDAGAAAPATTEGLRALIQCFRPETASSRYGGAVQATLKSSAALVLGALLLVIARARRGRIARRP